MTKDEKLSIIGEAWSKGLLHSLDDATLTIIANKAIIFQKETTKQNIEQQISNLTAELVKINKTKE